MSEVAGRIRRLNCVRELMICGGNDTLQQEMALILCRREDPLWQGRSILWEDGERVCFQLTDSPAALDRFVADNAPHILDVSRSGAVTIAIGKGEDHQ